MSSQSLAIHWQGGSGDVNMGELEYLLLMVSAFTSVRNLVRLLACTDWAVRCIALLCFAIHRPLLVCAFGKEVRPSASFIALT